MTYVTISFVDYWNMVWDFYEHKPTWEKESWLESQSSKHFSSKIDERFGLLFQTEAYSQQNPYLMVFEVIDKQKFLNIYFKYNFKFSDKDAFDYDFDTL
jgi:hypothetical protein